LFGVFEEFCQVGLPERGGRVGAVPAGFRADGDEHVTAAPDPPEGVLQDAELRRASSRRTGVDKAMDMFLAIEKVTGGLIFLKLNSTTPQTRLIAD
jgi:hypothetical protein